MKYKKNAIYNVDHRTKNYLANVLLFKASLQYSSKEFLQSTGVDAANVLDEHCAVYFWCL